MVDPSHFDMKIFNYFKEMPGSMHIVAKCLTFRYTEVKFK